MQKIIGMSLFFVLLVVTAQGANIWQVETGEWDTSTNWNGGVPVSGGGYAYINNAGTAQVTSSGAVCSRLYLGEGSSSSGTVDIQSGGELTVETFFFVGRGSGSGTANVSGGGSLVNNGPALIANQTATTTGVMNVDGAGTTWTSNDDISVGETGNGTLNVTSGGEVIAPNEDIYLGRNTGAEGTMNITGGSVISTKTANLGLVASSNGTVEVSGEGSKWINTISLFVGRTGTGTLTITDGGFVSVGGALTIDTNGGDDSFVKMGEGATLALFGEATDLDSFLVLISGTDAIEYWNGSTWDNITNATAGSDYIVTAGTGDLTGYAVLSMVPEPATLGLLSFAAVAGILRKRK